MTRIKKHLPLASFALAGVALFVALGTNAIGAGGGPKAGAASGGSTAHVSVLNSATTLTINGPDRTVAPGTQFVGATATCPFRYRVMGGGVFSESTNVTTNINTSQPTSSRTWSVDYNNGSQEPVRIHAVARCIRFR